VLAHRPGHLLSICNSTPITSSQTRVSLYLFRMPTDLVSVTEIAEIFGISRQRVNQLIQSYDDFPAPEAELAIGRVWLRSSVEAWALSHPRRPGRPAGASTATPTTR
jgi:predicted DNA-binding transcriptional regulator AlpA